MSFNSTYLVNADNISTRVCHQKTGHNHNGNHYSIKLKLICLSGFPCTWQSSISFKYHADTEEIAMILLIL